MFHYDQGLKLTAVDLAIDVCRRQPRGFISHAHADHMARHALAYCTPETSRFYEHRLGPRPTVLMPYGQPRRLGPLELTTFPAGHIVGSAMLLADAGSQRLLYTGDFQLQPALTAEAARLPRAEILVMESTFGDPRYRFPPRSQVLADLVELVQQIRRENWIPVVHAYVLGKAQEAAAALAQAGLRVAMHPLVFDISRIYEQLGCRLGPLTRYEPAETPAADVVLFPPATQRRSWLPLPTRRRRIALSGWAVSPDYRHRQGVDHALPLSDHADFDDLLRCVEQVRPDRVYCTHGPVGFVDQLRRRGYDAHRLEQATAGPEARTPPV